MVNLGERIYNARKHLGLSLEAVGQYVGVGKSTVRKWEQGTIQNMRRDKIKKLSEVLHVSPGYIMGWTDDSENYSDISLPTESHVDLADLSDFECEVIRMIRLLSEDQQQAFLGFLKSLLSTQKP